MCHLNVASEGLGQLPAPETWTARGVGGTGISTADYCNGVQPG